MAKSIPQTYEITLLGSEQEVMGQVHLPYPLPESFDDSLIDRQDEREVHFRTVQRGAGAAGYEARLMQPREARQLLRKLRREEIKEEIIVRAARLTGLDNMIELLPAMAELEQSGYQPNMGDAHFARS